jgi:uncharacterized protein (TIGR00255 family)
MTGFARVEGQQGPCSWTWEAKSVNGRSLDVRCRLPPGFDDLEQPARERAHARFRRGNVYLTLSLTWSESRIGVRVNRRVLDEIIAVLPEIANRLPDVRPPSLDGLLAARGVLEPNEEGLSADEREALVGAFLGTLDAALARLVSVREREGARLQQTLDEHVSHIERLAVQAEGVALRQRSTVEERLKSQVAELLSSFPALPDDRLAQEAALLMTRIDVREEIDRLKAHAEAARELIASREAAGRRLEFLCQELNREANTLCSKSADVELTRVGIEIKAAVDRLREQVQNIE